MEKRVKGRYIMCLLILLQMLLSTQGCPSDGKGCSSCITNQMKNNCPGCVPIMRCMATCLWGGNDKFKCIKKCDCNGGYPRPEDCKKCLAKCKCSCTRSS
ncbi:hypothetical protein Leryth_021302 [Lithospermum erythrorhizon]|nr:hypothetical protein Leryth_021302 [Lithospermum erythrorhizon]